MTPWERKLWYEFLRDYPLRFQRQKSIGNYIVDFYIASNRTVIEIDGAQHHMVDHQELDKQRDEELKKLNICVLRYTNEDIRKRFSTVCQDILDHLHLTTENLYQ